MVTAIPQNGQAVLLGGARSIALQAESTQRSQQPVAAPYRHTAHITYLFNCLHPQVAATPTLPHDFSNVHVKISRFMNLAQKKVEVDSQYLTSENLIEVIKKTDCPILHIDCRGTQQWLNPQTRKPETALLR